MRKLFPFNKKKTQSMRSSNKSRSRNKSSSRRSHSGGGNIVNRVFDSAGPEGRVRGTPQQIIEKYRGLAHDALLADDRVRAESLQQHAEHYARLLLIAQKQQTEQQAQQAERQAQQQAQQAERQAQQAERQAEQAERQTRQQQTSQTSQAGRAIEDEQPDVPGGFEAMTGEQPEVDSGLVATPESKPAKRAPRKRRKPEQGSDTPADTPVTE